MSSNGRSGRGGIPRGAPRTTRGTSTRGGRITGPANYSHGSTVAEDFLRAIQNARDATGLGMRLFVASSLAPTSAILLPPTRGMSALSMSRTSKQYGQPLRPQKASQSVGLPSDLNSAAQSRAAILRALQGCDDPRCPVHSIGPIWSVAQLDQHIASIGELQADLTRLHQSALQFRQHFVSAHPEAGSNTTTTNGTASGPTATHAAAPSVASDVPIKQEETDSNDSDDSDGEDGSEAGIPGDRMQV